MAIKHLRDAAHLNSCHHSEQELARIPSLEEMWAQSVERTKFSLGFLKPCDIYKTVHHLQAEYLMIFCFRGTCLSLPLALYNILNSK